MVDTEHRGSRECRWTGKQSRRLYHTNNEIEFILFYLHDEERINITSCESDLLSFHQTSLVKSNWNWAMSKQWPLAFKNWDKPLPVTFIGEPNGSHSLWTNCWGKPRQACNRWSEWTGDCWQCVLCLGTAHGRKKKKTEKNLKFLLCYIRHMETQQWMEAHTETHTQYNTLLSQQDKQHSKTAPA